MAIRVARVSMPVALLIMAFGLVFVGVGWWQHLKNQPFEDGVTTQAKVTDVQTGGSGSTTTSRTRSYARVLTFTAENGKQVTFTESTYRSRYPALGESVQVSYRPSDPQSARVVAGWRGWTGIAVAAVAWGIFVVFIALVLIAVRRNPRAFNTLPM